MVDNRFVGVGLVAFAALMLLPAATLAQTGIAGVVKDTTGAVLPGATVEASSPALIEKIRTVATDDQGQYKIIDLRPGTYTVTFTLAGFSTVRREGIELTTNFTANVNAEMRVGTIEETVTVSGQSPVVDVQNVVQQRVITRDVIDALPTGRTFQNLAVLIPGVVLNPISRPSAQDVGGSAGSRHNLAIHGGRPNDMTILLDGLRYNAFGASGGVSVLEINNGEVQEQSFVLGGHSAESPTGGIRVNTIPKEGGNLFKGIVFADFSNNRLQSDNATDELRARGLSALNRLNKVWDINPSFGGRIKQDKLWFFGSFRHWGLHDSVAGMWYDKDPYDFVYTPDLSRQATDNYWHRSEGIRLTWQATQKNKLGLYVVHQNRVQEHISISATRAPEAAGSFLFPRLQMGQATWNSPVTARLLLEAGVAIVRAHSPRVPQPGVTPEIVSVLEQSTNLLFRADTTYGTTDYNQNSYRAALSLVTGSHAFKVGFSMQQGLPGATTTANGDMNLQLLNGVPRSVTVWATPLHYSDRFVDAGIFAQEQWTINRLTLNLGVRFDYFNAWVLEQHVPAGRFVPARDFSAVSDVPNWTDLNPRLGASYDLFGTGKTALKVSLGRYVEAQTTDFVRANNPLNTSVNSATRTWVDRNGDFVPQEDELGPLSNASFGKVVIRTRYDDPVRDGFGSRVFNWETAAGVQHELRPGVSIDASYHRRWYGNFTVTDNLAVTPADYDPYCITAPVDARLPGGGGNQICGLYDIKPSKFGQVNNLISFAKNYGKQTEIYDGGDLTISARLPHGGLFSGGLNTGRSATNNCVVTDSPQLRFCDVSPPFQTQFKGLGAFHLPWDLEASGTFQSGPGPQMTASYVVPNAQIRGSLGRDLAAGAQGTATVELMAPGTRYDTRLYQVDVRVSKIFRVGRTRLQGNFDLYNALNANPVILVNNRYGPAWRQPTYILPGRLFKFGAQVDFSS